MNEFHNIIETWEEKFKGRHSVEEEISRFKCLNAFLQSQVKPKDLLAEEDEEMEEESPQKQASSEVSSFYEASQSANKTRNRNSLLLRDLDGYRNNSLSTQPRGGHEQKKRFSLKNDFDLIHMEEDSSEEEEISNSLRMPAIPEEFTTGTPKSRQEKEPNGKGEFLFLIFNHQGSSAPRKRRLSTAFDISSVSKCNLTDFTGSQSHRGNEIETIMRKGDFLTGNPFFLLSPSSHENNRIALDSHNRIFIEETEPHFDSKGISVIIGLSGSGIFVAHPKSQAAYNFFTRKSLCHVGFTKKSPKFFHPCLKIEESGGKIIASDTMSVKGVFVRVPEKMAMVAEPETLVQISKKAFLSFEFIKSSSEMHYQDEVACINGDEPQEMIKSFLTTSPVASCHKAKRTLFHEKSKFIEECIRNFPLVKVNLVRFDSISNRYVQRRAIILYLNTKSYGKEESSTTNFIRLEDFTPFNFLNSLKLKFTVGFDIQKRHWFYYSSQQKSFKTKDPGSLNTKRMIKENFDYRQLSKPKENSDSSIRRSLTASTSAKGKIGSLNPSLNRFPKPMTSIHEIQSLTEKPEPKASIWVSLGEFHILQGKFTPRPIELSHESEIQIDGQEMKLNYANLNKLSY